MSYPAAPWTLYGHALLTLNLLDIDRVRPFVPPEFKIVSVFPGKTLGGIYLSQYQGDSVLQYNELIVTPATVNFAGKVGSWVSHIYVDHPDSIAGGREIWGLPKEMAEFTWETGEKSRVTVRQGEQRLCSLTYGSPFSLWKQSMSGQSFGGLDTDVLLFKGETQLRPGLVSAQLDVSLSSPFAAMQFGQPLLTIAGQELQLQVDAPQVVGHFSGRPDRQPVAGNV